MWIHQHEVLAAGES